MPQHPVTEYSAAKIDLLRKALQVAPMQWNLTGMSMFPAIRPGDACRVQAVEPNAIRLGDIILVTRDGRLFAHRVVSMEAGSIRTWLMKGDTLLLPDPIVEEEQILGQVIGVERNGRFKNLCSPAHRAAGRLMAAVSGPYSRAFVWLVLARRRLLAKLARLSMWRAFRRARAASIVIRRGSDQDADGLALLFGEQQALSMPMNRIDMGAVRAMARRMLNSAQEAGATVWVAEMDGFLAGHAVVGPLGADGPDVPDWWVMSVYVKMTARGCGIAERLVRAGMDDAVKHGQPCIHYAAFETNHASLALAAKLGFVPEENDTSRRFAARYDSMGRCGPRLIVTRKDF